MKKVTVSDLVNVLRLKVQHGTDFLDREIYTSELSRPGLELTGYFEFYPEKRIQLLGRSEISFIEQMTTEKAKEIMHELCREEVPAFIISRNLKAPESLVEAAFKAKIPILQSSSKTTSVFSNLTNYLESKLAERLSVHGVFVDIFGMGVLITGDSGVGKSETALELIQKGHRLVADDRVDLYQLDELTLVGEAPSILQNLLEIRGVGIIDIMTLFGAGAIRDTKKLNLIVHLEQWNKEKNFERLGTQQEMLRILDVDIPKFSIPVKTGRNLSIIIEAATMNFRAKTMGYDASEVFQRNLDKLIAENSI